MTSVAFTIAMYYAYRRFNKVPDPLQVPFPVREHLTIKKCKNYYLNLYKLVSSATVASGRISLKLKILSYNLLADCYSKYFMFKYVRHGYLAFKYRSARILHEIE